MTAAKICGLSTPEAVAAALEGGASHVGFMFFAKSPRNIDPHDAARLAQPVRRTATKVVAVMVDPDDAAVDQIAGALRPDFIQLHGAEPPARVREVAARVGCGVIKVFPVSEAADIEAARAYEGVADHLMFDAKA